MLQPWTRAGWELLPTESGVCRGFVRRYGPDGLEAVLEVEGIAVWSESARATAVGVLRFAVAAGADGARRALTLGELPAVLFSEAVRDARAMVERVSG